ncbi:MAG: hypothetical protein ACXW36_10495, partial [Nitrospira sp.]
IFAIQPITGICLILGIIDLVFALVIHKTQSKAIFLSIFGGLYICLGILGHGLMRTIEIPSVNLEDGIKYINECAVTTVSYDHNSEQGNMYFERGNVPLPDYTDNGLVENIMNVSGIVKYHETGVRVIDVRDVKRFAETGYAVKDRCGYEFGGWVDGIEWFMKNTRT